MITRRSAALLVALAALASGPSLRAQAPPAATAKVPIVAVTGCLMSQGANWTLTAATDPVPSVANGPAAGQKIDGPTSGKAQYRLLGVSEFDLPAHQGHTVLVKGLLVKTAADTRVNVTSVTMVATSCAAAAKR